MAAFTKINDFVEDLGNAVHNFGSHTLKVALSNTTPASETSNPTADGNGVLANVTEISYTNYSDDMATDRVCENVGWVLSSGTATLGADDIVITASGGAVATFRYVYIYNDTAVGDPLIGVWDYGSGLTLSSGDSVTLDFGDDGGTDGTVLTVT